MFYNVTVRSTGGQDEVRLDLTEDELLRRYVRPYLSERPILIGGRTLSFSDIERINIYESEESAATVMPRVLKSQAESMALSLASDELLVAREGRDVTDRYFAEKYEITVSSGGETAPQPVRDPRLIFVVHGRNAKARDAMFTFLWSLGLHPMEWNEAVAATGQTNPYVGEILDASFAQAQVLLVLMTPDDVACLRPMYRSPQDPPHETRLTGQARLNVIFEAGMALGREPERTVLVELGDLRPMSDTLGRHVIRLNDSSQRRQELAQRLQLAGADVNMQGVGWHTAGDFNSAVVPFDEKELDEDGD